jgi:hypothetical protein
VTLLTWFLGAVALPLLLAQVTALWPWLAEKLVRRAARRIPEQDRPRWEAELLGELASKPNGLFQFLWALWQLPLLRGTGEMGRLLGAPPITQVVRARVRAALQKLRLRPKAPAAAREERAISLQATASAAAAAVADLRVVSRSASTGGAALRTTLSWSPPWRPGMSAQEFAEWLAEGQGNYEKWLTEGQQEFEKEWLIKGSGSSRRR